MSKTRIVIIIIITKYLTVHLILIINENSKKSTNVHIQYIFCFKKRCLNFYLNFFTHKYNTQYTPKQQGLKNIYTESPFRLVVLWVPSASILEQLRPVPCRHVIYLSKFSYLVSGKKGKVMERRILKDFQIGIVEGIIKDVISREIKPKDVFSQIAKALVRRGSTDRLVFIGLIG